jgi:hypothetical protein
MTARLRHAASALAALLLAGCAGGHGRPAQAAAPPAAPAPDDAPRTGIAACDGYLASYRACHLAARIFPPGQVDARYRGMRDSLLESARDPRVRPLLEQRCHLLARQQQEALHGARCAAP